MLVDAHFEAEQDDSTDIKDETRAGLRNIILKSTGENGTEDQGFTDAQRELSAAYIDFYGLAGLPRASPVDEFRLDIGEPSAPVGHAAGRYSSAGSVRSVCQPNT